MLLEITTLITPLFAGVSLPLSRLNGRLDGHQLLRTFSDRSRGSVTSDEIQRASADLSYMFSAEISEEEFFFGSRAKGGKSKRKGVSLNCIQPRPKVLSDAAVLGPRRRTHTHTHTNI